MAKESNLIYLDRNIFYFYSEPQDRIYNFDLSTFSYNLEIFNQENLELQIKNLVEVNKIPLGNLIIILSENLLFAKAFPIQIQNPDDDVVQTFTDSVPFDHIVVKSFPVEGGKLIVAANKEYYGAIEKGFTKVGFPTNIVVPVYALQITMNPNGLDNATAKLILKSADAIRPSGIEAVEPPSSTSSQQSAPAAADAKKKEKNTTYLLLGVFLVLLAVLGIFGYNSMQESAKTTKKKVTKVILSPTPVPAVGSQIVASSAATLLTETIRIKIYTPPNPTSTSGQVLSSALTAQGFKIIQEEPTQSKSNNSVIIFSPNVGQATRTQVSNIVAQLDKNFVIQEAQNPEADILIFPSL